VTSGGGEPDPTPSPEGSSQQEFQGLLQRLLSVPKTEIDARLRAEKKRARRPPPTEPH